MSFFKDTLNVNKNARICLFYTICISIRATVGWLVFNYSSNIITSFVVFLWGYFNFMLNLLFLNSRKEQPWWWTRWLGGLWRNLFALLIMTCGMISIIIFNGITNKIAAGIIWFDVFKGTIQYTIINFLT